MEWIARGLGLFYLVGGVLTIRAARMNSILDKALAAIDLTPTPWTERVRAFALWSAVLLTSTGGLSLLLLARWTVWIFVLNLVCQIAYLAFAARWLKPEDALERQGRDQTRNAALIWGVATLAVIWWTGEGVLAWTPSVKREP
jgi:hypothetical protein